MPAKPRPKRLNIVTANRALTRVSRYNLTYFRDSLRMGDHSVGGCVDHLALDALSVDPMAIGAPGPAPDNADKRLSQLRYRCIERHAAMIV